MPWYQLLRNEPKQTYITIENGHTDYLMARPMWEKEVASRRGPICRENVIRAAKEIWLNPKLRAIFERVGRRDHTTDIERLEIEDFLDSKFGESHKYSTMGYLGFAEGIVRRFVAQEINALDRDDVVGLMDRYYRGDLENWEPADCHPEQVQDTVYAILTDNEAREDWREHPDGWTPEAMNDPANPRYLSFQHYSKILGYARIYGGYAQAEPPPPYLVFELTTKILNSEIDNPFCDAAIAVVRNHSRIHPDRARFWKPNGVVAIWGKK